MNNKNDERCFVCHKDIGAEKYFYINGGGGCAEPNTIWFHAACFEDAAGKEYSQAIFPEFKERVTPQQHQGPLDPTITYLVLAEHRQDFEHFYYSVPNAYECRLFYVRYVYDLIGHYYQSTEIIKLKNWLYNKDYGTTFSNKLYDLERQIQGWKNK